MAHQSRFAGYAGFVAALSMAFTPAQAAETTVPGTMGFATAAHAEFRGGTANPFNSSTYNSEAETSEWRRGRWGRRGFRRHRRGIRGGDVLAGVLILGGIAAVASAASNNRRRDRDVVVIERDRDNRRFDNRRDNPRASGGSGIDNAVSQCLAEIEQDVRVDSVDGASRLASGWLVTGTLFNGSGFTCQIDNNGRISNIDYGGFSASNDVEGSEFAPEGQFSDTTYADARAGVRDNGPVERLAERQEQADVSGEALPPYPGGPLPGEDLSE